MRAWRRALQSHESQPSGHSRVLSGHMSALSAFIYMIAMLQAVGLYVPGGTAVLPSTACPDMAQSWQQPCQRIRLT